MHTVDISFLQTQDGYRFILFFLCVCVYKPHRFSVASYMCRTLGGAVTLDLAYRAGLCIMQWKYIILMADAE